MKWAGLLAATLLLTHCGRVQSADLFEQRFVPRTDAETAFAKQVLDDLQRQSFTKNREYCGYIGIDDAGAYTASPATRGRRGSCLAKRAPSNMQVLASYHTHGAHSSDYDSEVPSTDDMASDIDEGTDGYIATPGGRVWFIDAGAETAILLCARGCVTEDPNYAPPTDYNIRPAYTLSELIAAEEAAE